MTSSETRYVEIERDQWVQRGSKRIVTQQYLYGELSLLLGQLQDVMVAKAGASEIAELRQYVEAGSVLTSATLRALKLADQACWESLGRGDVSRFSRQAAVSSRLWDFGVCAGFIEERHTLRGTEVDPVERPG
jgi:hypothetical protein